jgi:thiol:disulfide interchange protein DsbA
MRIVRFVLSVLCLLAFADAGFATPLIEGQDYAVLYPAQTTEPGKKVEVIEFFAYYCPHCNALDQPLADWVKKQGDNIIFKRIHTSVTGDPVPQQRLYYALETMGKEEEFHKKILTAIHFQKLHLDDDDDIIGFMVRQGMDRQKFTDVYRSFAVQSKVNRAIKMQSAYLVNTWPTIVLDGRIATSPPLVGAKLETYDEKVAQNMMLAVMDELVTRLRQDRARADASSTGK